MLRLRCQIAHLVAIGSKIVQFLNWLRLPEGALYGVQLALIVELLPNRGSRRLEHIVDVLTIDPIRHEIPHIDIPLVSHGPNHVISLVHPPAESVDERLRRPGVSPEKGMTLMPRLR